MINLIFNTVLIEHEQMFVWETWMGNMLEATELLIQNQHLEKFLMMKTLNELMFALQRSIFRILN